MKDDSQILNWSGNQGKGTNLYALQTSHPRIYGFLRRWSLRGLPTDFSTSTLKGIGRKFKVHPEKLWLSIQAYRKYFEIEGLQPVSKPDCIPKGGTDE